MRLRTLFVSTLFAPAVAFGQQTAQHGTDLAIGVRAGTFGIGGEVNKLLVSHVGVRVGANFFNFNTTRDQSDISFDAKLKLKAVTGLVDLYPSARGKFHFTGGIISNPLEVTGIGIPRSNVDLLSTFTINWHTYQPSAVGTLNGSAKFSSTLPYAGIGFGTPATNHRTVKFVFDIGAAIGTPNVLLTASNAGSNAQLAADVHAQQVKTQDDVNKYIKVYPNVTIGLMFAF